MPVAVHQLELGSLKASTVAKFTPQLFFAYSATADEDRDVHVRRGPDPAADLGP